MYDSFYEQYNYLEILTFNQKNDKLNVKIRNVDDGYVQDFTFDSFKNFEIWFRRYHHIPEKYSIKSPHNSHAVRKI